MHLRDPRLSFIRAFASVRRLFGLGVCLSFVLLLLGGRPAHALQVDGYTDAVNNRFTDWSSDLTPNSDASFALAGLDMSGLFWDASGRTYAALSNQTFIGSHAGLGAGDTISYWNGTSIGTATIAGSLLLTDPASGPADSELYMYTLTSALSGVNALPILSGGSAEHYEGMQIAMFGQGGRVVLETLDLLAQVTYTPNAMLQGPYNSIENEPGSDIAGAAQEHPGLYESGDSNSAVLGLWNGQWGILGAAWAITEPPSPQFSLFNFMPAYVDELPGTLNYSVLAVPEPGRVLLLALGTMAAIFRRKRIG